MGGEDSTFHLKVPLQLKLGHFSQSVHVAETATHAFCLALLAGKNEILLQQRPSTFPLIGCLQQMCWVHICLLWTWSFMETVTKRPLGTVGPPATAQHPTGPGIGICTIPTPHTNRELKTEVFWGGGKHREGAQVFPGALLFSLQVILAQPEFSCSPSAATWVLPTCTQKAFKWI